MGKDNSATGDRVEQVDLVQPCTCFDPFWRLSSRFQLTWQHQRTWDRQFDLNCWCTS